MERRLRWEFMGRSGCTTSTVLRSGMVLSASAVHWERPWSVSVDQIHAPLKLVLMRGRGPRMTTSDGDDHKLHGGMFHVSCIHRPVRLTFDFDEPRATAHHEELSSSSSRASCTSCSAQRPCHADRSCAREHARLPDYCSRLLLMSAVVSLELTVQTALLTESISSTARPAAGLHPGAP